jgi:hypothetical protein
LPIFALQVLIIFGGNRIVKSSASSSTEQTLFWISNDPAHPSVNGISTYGVINTSQKFSSSPATSKNTSTLTQDWYLYPTLAGAYSINGNIYLGIWINAPGSSPSGTPMITLYERSSSGTETQVTGTETSLGSKSLFNTPHYLNLSLSTSSSYTLQKGSSVHLVLSIRCGSSTTCEI